MHISSGGVTLESPMGGQSSGTHVMSVNTSSMSAAAASASAERTMPAVTQS